jgi:[ribosomal protein S18]-alanine N-acetyltransferase
MPITIRSATLTDLPLILAVEQQAASAAHWPAEEYEKLVKTGVVLVAEQAGQLCGFICANIVAGEWEIENLVVERRWLRQGIADRLMRTLIEQAEKGAASRILLEVRESNLSARKLYQKYGFRELGRRPEYYSQPLEDATLYARSLESEK